MNCPECGEELDRQNSDYNIFCPGLSCAGRVCYTVKDLMDMIDNLKTMGFEAEVAKLKKENYYAMLDKGLESWHNTCQQEDAIFTKKHKIGDPDE